MKKKDYEEAGLKAPDYFENESNDGNIGIFLKNITDEVLEIKQGDRIAQGMFCNYLVTVDDKPIKETRVGGFGSTN